MKILLSILANCFLIIPILSLETSQTTPTRKIKSLKSIAMNFVLRTTALPNPFPILITQDLEDDFLEKKVYKLSKKSVIRNKHLIHLNQMIKRYEKECEKVITPEFVKHIMTAWDFSGSEPLTEFLLYAKQINIDEKIDKKEKINILKRLIEIAAMTNKANSDYIFQNAEAWINFMMNNDLSDYACNLFSYPITACEPQKYEDLKTFMEHIIAYNPSRDSLNNGLKRAAHQHCEYHHDFSTIIRKFINAGAEISAIEERYQHRVLQLVTTPLGG